MSENTEKTPKCCPWCNPDNDDLEYWIYDSNFPHDAIPDRLINYCFNCGRKLDNN